jgi:hypothetical protein
MVAIEAVKTTNVTAAERMSKKGCQLDGTLSAVGIYTK